MRLSAGFAIALGGMYSCRNGKEVSDDFLALLKRFQDFGMELTERKMTGGT